MNEKITDKSPIPRNLMHFSRYTLPNPVKFESMNSAKGFTPDVSPQKTINNQKLIRDSR